MHVSATAAEFGGKADGAAEEPMQSDVGDALNHHALGVERGHAREEYCDNRDNTSAKPHMTSIRVREPP